MVEASSDAPIAEASGVNGQVQLLEDRVKIGRKGFGARMMLGRKADREVPLSQIGSVKFQPVGRFVDGYIQFALVREEQPDGQTPQPATDETTVTFTRSQQPEFERLHSAIKEHMWALTQVNDREALANLEKLASLRDKGIITDQEFNAKKKQILGL